MKGKKILGIELAILLTMVMGSSMLKVVCFDVCRVTESERKVFRLLALESLAGVNVARDAQRLISTLLECDNWSNRSGFTSYIEFLSPCNESQIFPECRPFWKGNNTKENLRDRIRNFLALAGPDEIVVFHYSGEGNVLILALYHEIINSSELLSWLDEVKATTICILDTCHAGSWVDDGAGGVLGPGRMVLAGCRSDQLSAVTRPKDPYGVFTGLKDADYYDPRKKGPVGIIGSLASKVDPNKDDWTSFGESFEFARTTVEQIMHQLQNPVMYNGLPNQEDPPFVLIPQPPISNFSFTPELPWVNESVLFNASTSYSPNGNITEYQWDFGDNNRTTTTEQTISHVFVNMGKYTVTLNVTDLYGQWNTTSRQITITFQTDLNKDGTVNILDITMVATAYNSAAVDNPDTSVDETEKWNPLADLDKNGTVNILDISAVAKDYGKTV